MNFFNGPQKSPNKEASSMTINHTIRTGFDVPEASFTALKRLIRDFEVVARMDGNNPPPPIFFTQRIGDQCALWTCRSMPLRPNDYCHNGCLERATSDSKLTGPHRMSMMYSSTTEFEPVATKILMLLKANKETGVPQLSSELLKSPPWQSSLFGVEFNPWEAYCEWLFISSDQILQTSDFKWVGGRSKMLELEGLRFLNVSIGEVKHCVFKPSVSENENEKWELHQYSSPDVMDKAVYVVRCNREDN